MQSKSYKNYIGIDVGKYKLDVYLYNQKEHHVVLNDSENLEKFLDRIKDDADTDKSETLVIIDLTGGYEKLCVDKFHSEGYKNIILAEGIKINNFKKSLKNHKAKTDKEDCILLCEYGKLFCNELKLYTKKDKNRDEIKDLYQRFKSLKDSKQQELNRLKRPNNTAFITDSIERQLKFLEEEIEIVRNELKKLTENNTETKLIYDTLLNERGIGEEIALFLLSILPELGKAERRQITNISGLAPQPKESGTLKQHRYIQGGRREIKKVMYFCVMNMIRFDKPYKKKLDEFVIRGKNKKVALCALARKKIIILNAIVKKQLEANGFEVSVAC
jgi:transposase